VRAIALKRPVTVPAFRLIVLCASTFLLFQFVSLYLSWPKQAVLGALSLAIVIVLNRSSRSKVVTIAVMLISLAATLRYAWWRIHLVANFFADEANNRVAIDSLLMLVLLSAEAYTILIMVLGYVQTSYPLHRPPVPLPPDEDEWPHVDVLIPTYNEPLALVRYTALAAINIDYPPDKLHVYILDDGSRENFRVFAEEAGVGYITRIEHNHAKAGNINHALMEMSSPFVAIFDCDHVPTRSFLQVTLGWFLAQDRLAMLQTPHHFYSPDPFERNLLQYSTIPNEAELFYGIIQDGNDLWNATFFCGSCAVIRREALDEVGGIAVETVTEDAHTSLRMQKNGWNTAYINIAQAAGLATETLAAHVGQRVRWARGMIQILRTDNPLLARGLNLSQRLCYFNAMIHFLYAVPRLIFLCAPLVYMLFGRTIIPGYWVAILAYALPHLFISNIANSRIQGRHRHSFWNEIYETVLAPYILLPTLLALINPKLGKFNVTDKGTTLSETQFDSSIAAPTTWLLFFNLLGVLVAPYRLFVLDTNHPGTVLSNLAWIFFNMVILGVAAAVAHEQQQRRSSVRIAARLPIVAQFADGRHVTGITRDMSVGGASILLSDPDIAVQRGDALQVAFPMQTGDAQVRAFVVGVLDHEIRLKFRLTSISEQEILTRALYSRADSWINDREHIEEDRPLLSLARVVRLSFAGFHQVLLGLLPRKRTLKKSSTRATGAAVLLLLSLLFPAAGSGQSRNPTASLAPPFAPKNAQPSTQPDATQPIPRTGSIATRITFADMGIQRSADLRGPHSYASVHFALAHTLLPQTATLDLTYHFDRLLPPAGASIQVRLNDTPLTLIDAPEVPMADGAFAFLRISVPAELLIRDNELSFEFNGGEPGLEGTRPAGKGPKAVALPRSLANIGASSSLNILSDPVPFQGDLSLLPLPLFDSALQTTTTVPFVFLTQPSPRTLEAAGIVASWLGILSSSKPVRFSVSIGQIPPGNVILFTDSPALLPAPLQVPGGGPALSIRSNPSDPNGSALVLAGDDEDQLLAVARALALTKGVPNLASGSQPIKQGDAEHIVGFQMPAPREPDDAPRWLPADRTVSLWTYSSQTALQGDGSAPIPLYFRVPPDLYYGENQNLQLHLSYRYNALPLAPGSALRIFINGVLINEAPLPPGTRTTDHLREVLVPIISMRPFANTLLFNFDFNPRHHPGDIDHPNTRLTGAILRNSSLDLHDLHHWVGMPDLELFANAGFPFTQHADLAQTVVVLPNLPTAHEIALFLHLMSHCGTQTGYPVLRVEVAGPDAALRPDRDYLVLGTLQNQPAFNALASALPVAFDANGLHLQPRTNLWTNLRHSVRKLLQLSEDSTAALDQAAMPEALIEGIASPYGDGRSLVVVALRDDRAEKTFEDVFLDRSQSSDIANSVSLLQAGHFASYNVDTPGYHIGTISWYTRMRIWLTDQFVLLVLIVSLLSLVLATWAREYLAARAALRLEAVSPENNAFDPT
jgi:cellulose synthase (UDP-forming)